MPTWIDWNTEEASAAADSPSLKNAYAEQFENRPPRLRKILRQAEEARRQAMAQVEAAGGAPRGGTHQLRDGEGVFSNHVCANMFVDLPYCFDAVLFRVLIAAHHASILVV